MHIAGRPRVGQVFSQSRKCRKIQRLVKRATLAIRILTFFKFAYRWGLIREQQVRLRSKFHENLPTSKNPLGSAASSSKCPAEIGLCPRLSLPLLQTKGKISNYKTNSNSSFKKLLPKGRREMLVLLSSFLSKNT